MIASGERFERRDLTQVDVFFSRDLDSRISEREVAAVQQFLASELPVSFIFNYVFYATVVNWHLEIK
jgi:hypothetical protein